jgi:hypothetical protein
MKVLLLTREMLADILGDPKFYDACPEFLHLRELGLACYTKYKLPGCSGCYMKIMAPAVVEFVRHCRRLQESNADRLESVKDYIGSRRPSRPQQVEMMSRFAGERSKLLF